jgi:hypothetical protein
VITSKERTLINHHLGNSVVNCVVKKRVRHTLHDCQTQHNVSSYESNHTFTTVKVAFTVTLKKRSPVVNGQFKTLLRVILTQISGHLTNMVNSHSMFIYYNIAKWPPCFQINLLPVTVIHESLRTGMTISHQLRLFCFSQWRPFI